MSTNDQMHPVRRIRAVFAGMSEESGLRDYSSIRGFAEFLGCSEGAIRKVEQTGEISDRLAQLIEWRTGVFARWLKSSPSPSDPIIGINGRPWNGENLDLFRLLPALKPMLVACPSTLPAVVGKLVEILLAKEFVNGEANGLIAVLQLLQRRGMLVKQELDEARLPSGLTVAGWRGSKLPPPLDEAFGLLVQADDELSEGQLRDLGYLKSVEPAANQGSRISGLLENYLRSRKRALRSVAAVRRRISRPED